MSSVILAIGLLSLALSILFFTKGVAKMREVVTELLNQDDNLDFTHTAKIYQFKR